MVTLAFLTAACLDPVQAALVLAIVMAYRGPHPIVVAGVAGALVAETIMMLGAADYAWGELIAPRLVAALLQASVSVLALWTARIAIGGAGAALGIWPPDDEAGAAVPTALPAPSLPVALKTLEPGSLPPRMALWHMRAYVRRRLYGLQKKKNAALDCESR